MLQRPRILVIEDDPDTLAAVATVLRDEDAFSVWVARTGEQALEVADELGFNADLVVLDLDLGIGMRGDQFALEYRRRAGRPTPIIVISGVSEAKEVALGIRATAPFPSRSMPRNWCERSGCLSLEQRLGVDRVSRAVTQLDEHPVYARDLRHDLTEGIIRARWICLQ